MSMMNLFSVFDPSSYLMNLNWMSVLFITFLIPSMYWTQASVKNFLLFKGASTIAAEMKMLLTNKDAGKSLFFISMIFFILMNNFMGLYPYIFTYTSHMTMTLSLALPAWGASLIYGWASKPHMMLAHTIPASTSYVLMPFMVCIETVSTFIRPMTLAIRLSTNMIAGHLLLTLLSNQNYYTYTGAIKFLVVMIQLLLLGLEGGVALVQAYVFSTLSLLYASESN